MTTLPLILWTEKGLFCPRGNFYIDPHRAVDLAIVTHAHSDHARRGCTHYICEESGAGLLKARLGKNISLSTHRYGKPFTVGDVKVSLHSAGHILGSAQVRVEFQGEVWVASGDYKRDRDPSCEPFEKVRCDTFITEATFGTPTFTWEKNLEHGRMIHEWWKGNAAQGFNSILFGYSLGKAQRILAELAPHAHRKILIHKTITALTDCYREVGRTLAETKELQEAIKELIFDQTLQGELILCPPSVLKESWASQLGRYKTAFASGWMQKGGFGHRRYDHGFIMSDHADWNDLNQTIEETGASRVFVQHRNGALIQHLKRKGMQAFPIEDLTVKGVFESGGIPLRLL